MEDATYCSSTQHRHWTFTADSLAGVRRATNAAAAAQVREAISRVREKKRKKRQQGNSINGIGETVGVILEGGAGVDGEVEEKEQDIECLTPEEELMLVRYYCRKIMEIAVVFECPTNVKATAPTFLRRFFTRISPMTYHPKTLLYTILYLTTKTENHYIPLETFSSKLPKQPSPEEILAPEFVVAMGLRWSFEIKHPFRGLEGCIMELMKVAEGNYRSPPPPPPPPPQHPPQLSSTEATQPPPPPPHPISNNTLPSAAEWQGRLHNLPPPPKSPSTTTTPKPRIERAHGKSRAILSGPALLTDAYFLYSPPQIALAAIYLIDSPLATFFLDLKLPHAHQFALRSALLSTVQSCADELRTGGDSGAPISKEELDEAMRIDRKLWCCRNPEKVDLVGASKAAKRGISDATAIATLAGDGGDGGYGGTIAGVDDPARREREVKKRKLEGEKSFREGEELFGNAGRVVVGGR